jgi:hypothetical protein
MPPAGTGLRISPIDLSLLIHQHGPLRPAACMICKGDMVVTEVRVGVVTYVCRAAFRAWVAAGAPSDLRGHDPHYRRSHMPVTYHGDQRIVDALVELRELRTAAGEDMTVEVDTLTYPAGHGRNRCWKRLRHLGDDRWREDFDMNYTHDPSHADLTPTG